MTRAELIDKIAKDAETTKATALKALDAVLEGIVQSVKKGNKVTLVGFGTFSSTKRKARKGRNPRTGEALKIKSSKTPKFTAGKAFKDAIN